MVKGKEFTRRQFLGQVYSLGMARLGIVQLQRTGRSTSTRGLLIASTREFASEAALGSLEYPREFPTPKWLESRGRLVFNQRITQKTTLEENWNLGVNMLGTSGNCRFGMVKIAFMRLRLGKRLTPRSFRHLWLGFTSTG
jgi:hypothetical protein